MENYNYRGKEVSFRTTRGKVLSQNKFSETHISSSGGGGYVGVHGGRVDAAQIHSSTQINHEFWIKSEDGLEKSVQLSGSNIPLREGQEITLITAGIAGYDSYHVGLVNHNEQKGYQLLDGSQMNKAWKLEGATGFTVVMVIIAVFGVILYSAEAKLDGEFFKSSLMIILALAALRVVYKLIQITTSESSIESHLQSLIKTIKKSAA